MQQSCVYLGFIAFDKHHESDKMIILTKGEPLYFLTAAPNFPLLPTSTSFYRNELLKRHKQGINWGPVCLDCFRPPGATHSLHSSLSLLHLLSLRPFLSTLRLLWSAVSLDRHWNKYLVSPEDLERRLAWLYFLVYGAVFILSWATNQSHYKICAGKGREGWMAVPCGHQRLTGVDTITMSISFCASGDTIHIHFVGACFLPNSQQTVIFDVFPLGR